MKMMKILCYENNKLTGEITNEKWAFASLMENFAQLKLRNGNIESIKPTKTTYIDGLEYTTFKVTFKRQNHSLIYLYEDTPTKNGIPDIWKVLYTDNTVKGGE